MKKEIKEFVENYYDDYYPQTEEGEVVGGIEVLIKMFCEKNQNCNEKEVEKTINEMIENDELTTYSVEMVNPENDQQTIYMDIITVSDFISETTNFRKVRKNQQSWEFEHPENYKSFDNFEEFKANTIKFLTETEMNTDMMPITLVEVKKWKKWDDVLTFDIL